MFIKAFQKGAHPVVPQLDRAVVEGGKDPWSLWMERNAFDAIAFRLELPVQLTKTRSFFRYWSDESLSWVPLDAP
jgi:hypothetical protein